ncbi:acetyltransferase [Brucella pseudogrignonensis]|uniref:GNAT family N-acetyltransferase n=1 Tax=Brucella pseudogrignonensis TaxID=419475 RepID=UPI0007DA5A74|nr:GNAT family N-acetyltransferase [Brucella pseudogrignonensis]ANG95942.1 acetyltransferase [Brucella pseudogrignonensis]
MAGLLKLRPAERHDAAEIAILVDISSHGFAHWLWQSVMHDCDAETVMEAGLRQMQEAGMEGWQGTTIAEWDGVTAGLSIGFTLDESLHELKPQNEVLAQLVALQCKVIGSRFIDSVAVYQKFRGKSIGRALVANEIAQAKLSGNASLSLITESHNSVALSLYRGYGFEEMERLEAVKRIGQDKVHDWVLLTRNVN